MRQPCTAMKMSFLAQSGDCQMAIIVSIIIDNPNWSSPNEHLTNIYICRTDEFKDFRYTV